MYQNGYGLADYTKPSRYNFVFRKMVLLYKTYSPVMRSFLYLFLLSVSILSFGQNKTRTRSVDYTRYDQMMGTLPYAPDKLKAAKALLDEVNKLFTPEDEEYFSGYKMISLYYEMAFDLIRAQELTQKAIDAYEKNYPFYNRGYATVTKETAVYIYTDFSRIQRSLNLFEKDIKFLESKRAVLDVEGQSNVRLLFYTEYAQALLGAERYSESVEIALKLRNLVESGALAINMQSADELFKINASDPPEVQAQMKTAKEQYEKTMREAQEATLSTQRILYNSVLGNAYFKQFQFKESVPYTQAWLTETTKLQAYAMKAMSSYQAQVNYPDSVKRQLKETEEFMTRMQQIGGSSLALVIAACKTDQVPLAEQSPKGEVDKAAYYQLTKQLDKAEQAYQTAFTLMKDLARYRFSGTASELMAAGIQPSYINLQVQKGNLELARTETLKAITREEEILKKSFPFFSEGEKKEFFKSYTQKLERYFSLLLLMAEKNKTYSEEVLNKLLQAKGIILDVTREQEKRLKKSKDKTVIDQINQIRKLRDKLSSFYQLSLKNPAPALADSINKVSVRINELERKVNEKLGALTDPLKPVTWKQVQAKLKQGEVYLEILRLKRENFLFDKPLVQYWAFVIKKDDSAPTFFQISEGETFDGRSLKNYQNRIKGNLDDMDSYKTYWAKINENLSGSKRIFLSGDGAYHMINPLTLKNPNTDKYLLSEIVLTRVSTGRDFLNPLTAPVAHRDVALIGNPSFEMSRRGATNQYLGKEVDSEPYREASVVRSGISKLPGTQKEVEIIQSMASTKGITTNVLAGNKANESLVKGLNNPSLLHIATHGEFDQQSKAESYLKSKLILAGAADDEPFSLEDYTKYEDGFLTAYEVTQLELSKTNLVVLSACETGLGEVQSGEGVWGLQRAFQLAGARTVMGSLWKISDEATVAFMNAFYQKYFSGADIQTSYQSAMEATLQQHPHPYFWGAFTITGMN
jgi:CHAT domain